MKNLKKSLAIIALSALAFTSCKTKEGNIDPAKPPTSEEFNALAQKAIEDRTEEFNFTQKDGAVSFTAKDGMIISFDANCLVDRKNPGRTEYGNITLKKVAMFDRGNMLATNKPTMAKQGDKKVLLISGGEFNLEVIDSEGNKLDTDCFINVQIPTNQTGGMDFDMQLWTGLEDEDGNVVWEREEEGELVKKDGEGADMYNAYFGDFGWTNVDKFYSDPRPKTTILVDAPEGYDNLNSAVYLVYDDQPNALANLDTYSNDLFSEHYGQIPIGLECNVVFATAEGENWRYAIKAVTIVENGIIEFTLSDTQVGTESDLVDAINNLP